MRSKALRAFNRSLLLILILVALKRDSLHPADFFSYGTDPFTAPHKFDWWAYELQRDKQAGERNRDHQGQGRGGSGHQYPAG